MRSFVINERQIFSVPQGSFLCTFGKYLIPKQFVSIFHDFLTFEIMHCTIFQYLKSLIFDSRLTVFSFNYRFFRVSFSVPQKHKEISFYLKKIKTVLNCLNSFYNIFDDFLTFQIYLI